jgi:hypothetical protein
VSGHSVIEGNAIDNQLAKKGPGHPFIRFEPACRILERAEKWAIRDWKRRKHGELLEVHV